MIGVDEMMMEDEQCGVCTLMIAVFSVFQPRRFSRLVAAVIVGLTFIVNENGSTSSRDSVRLLTRLNS